jgi:hypothetical protein
MAMAETMPSPGKVWRFQVVPSNQLTTASQYGPAQEKHEPE